jgi:hypothetical protein
MLSAVGKEISPACNGNPTKVTGSERLVPRIAQTLDAWRKEDQPIMKKLPVEADAPELLVKWGSGTEGSAFKEAVGDLALIGFYYLLCIVKYTAKGIQNEMKQTQHSLQIGGANALSLAGYSDQQLQKMGRWRSETFKEYVCEQLSTFFRRHVKKKETILRVHQHGRGRLSRHHLIGTLNGIQCTGVRRATPGMHTRIDNSTAARWKGNDTGHLPIDTTPILYL